MRVITITSCDPWESYIQQLTEDAERDARAQVIDADLEHEAHLARAYAYANTPLGVPCDVCPWPYYADDATETIDGC